LASYIAASSPAEPVHALQAALSAGGRGWREPIEVIHQEFEIEPQPEAHDIHAESAAIRLTDGSILLPELLPMRTIAPIPRLGVSSAPRSPSGLEEL
jgi:hypothetical protein